MTKNNPTRFVKRTGRADRAFGQTMKTEIVTLAGEWPDEPGLYALLQDAVARTLNRLELKTDTNTELSIALSDNAHLQSLNRDFRKTDQPTNVLAFQRRENPEIQSRNFIPNGLLGDIILASGVVSDEAGRDGKSFSDHAVHLTIHGLLHLLGYSHENEVDANDMESVEVEVLNEMNIADPYQVGQDSAGRPEQSELI